MAEGEKGTSKLEVEKELGPSGKSKSNRRASLVHQAEKALMKEQQGKPHPKDLLDIFPESTRGSQGSEIDFNRPESLRFLSNVSTRPENSSSPSVQIELADVGRDRAESGGDSDVSTDEDDYGDVKNNMPGLHRWASQVHMGVSSTQEPLNGKSHSTSQLPRIAYSLSEQDGAPLSRKVLKFDMKTFDRFVPDKLHRQERLQFLVVWKNLGNTMPILSRTEARSYRELMKLLTRLHKTGSIQSYTNTNTHSHAHRYKYLPLI